MPSTKKRPPYYVAKAWPERVRVRPAKVCAALDAGCDVYGLENPLMYREDGDLQPPAYRLPIWTPSEVPGPDEIEFHPERPEDSQPCPPHRYRQLANRPDALGWVYDLMCAKCGDVIQRKARKAP